MLTFQSPQTRQLADQLMQPALIRIIDNIRKQLENSDWKGTYQETQIWPEGTEEITLQRFKQLQSQLSTASPEAADAIRSELTQMPQPFPGYELHLTKDQQEHIVDVWELCYCVCFEQYPVEEGPVAIDLSIIDCEVNDVDWLALDTKAKSIVEDIFYQIGAHP